MNVGRRGIRGTVGLPGSDLSYSESAPWHRRGHLLAVEPTPRRPGLLIGFVVLVAIGVFLIIAVGR